MINHIKFCHKMIHKYESKYSQLPIDIFVDIIDIVLNRAPGMYFTYEQVQEHPEFCKQCGACCKTLDCKYFNGKTCDEYATRFDACAEFPWYEINGETGLMLDPYCQFAVKLAEMVLEEELDKEMEFLEVD